MPSSGSAAGTPPQPSDTLKAERDRFVALAFCWADILIELDRDHKVVYAAGPTRSLLGVDADKLGGRDAKSLIDPEDMVLFGDLLSAARHHGRIDNVPIRLKGPHGATPPLLLAGYCLKEMREHFFLALRVAHARHAALPGAGVSRDISSGLYDAEGFSSVAIDALSPSGAAGTGDGRHLTLIDIPDLADVREGLDAEADDRLQRTIGAYLKARSLDGDSAGRITPERFGLVHAPDFDVEELRQRLAIYTQTAAPGAPPIEVKTATIDADITEVDSGDLATGVLFLLNHFRRSEGKSFTLERLSSNLSDFVGEAVQSVGVFKRMVRDESFRIAFQPIVDIYTGKAHHFEALARFPKTGTDDSPYRYITFAEETGLIRDFDMAMARKAVDWLAANGKNGEYKIAVNLSGYSIAEFAFVVELHQLLDDNPWTRAGLMFEVTESSRIDDLASANTFVQSLRRKGYEVCLDDFGAGAANFQYLAALEVDIVKLDGEALREARSGPRGKAFVKALATLCDELGTAVIAEMVDDLSGLEFIRDCGVRYAQGYLYGKPDEDVTAYKPKGKMNWSD